jgi:competence protein ComEC
MRSAVIGFVLGVCLLQARAVLPDLLAVTLLLSSAIGFVWASRHIERPAARTALVILAGAATGFVWAAAFAHVRLQQSLPPEFEGKDIAIVGTVVSLPHRVEQGVRFNFSVEEILTGGSRKATVPSKIALSWYGGFGKGGGMAVDVQPGERWTLNVRLKRPHGNANPHGFDYEVWLLEQGVRATGYVRASDRLPIKNERVDAFVLTFGNVVERARAKLREHILASLPGKPYAGVIVALVIGDQRAIPQSDWEVFNRTGIGHLISISGLHITMIAGLFASLVFVLWRRSFFTNAQLPLHLPAQKAAAAAGALAALVYVLLAGSGVPAQRTLIMVSTVALALWAGRLAGISHVLCAALALVVLFDPWAVLWPGFWLSFGAVAVILYANAGRVLPPADTGAKPARRWADALRSASHTQYVVTLGLVPLTMLLFGQVSLISPLANAIAIPLISLFVAPVSLVASVLPQPLSGWMLSLTHGAIEQLAAILAWFSDMGGAVWTAPLPSLLTFGIALIGTLWMLAPSGWPFRWAGLAGWLPLVLATADRPPEGEMRVTAFDVGQGMSLLVETSSRRLLYDTGPSYSPDSDAGDRVVLPYLKAHGIDRLDGLVISHSDIDHSGGASSIIGAIPVGWTASSLDANSALTRAAPAHRRCVAGQKWSWDGVSFEMLYPEPSLYEQPKLKPNARSCVLKATVKGRAILLAGDIEAAQEARLLAANRGQLRANVLLAPHHGSGASSTLAFLQAVQPEIALFQVGYRNRFRHPKSEVFTRYGNLGIRRLRTDESGALTLHFGDTLEVSEYRTKNKRYWHGR